MGHGIRLCAVCGQRVPDGFHVKVVHCKGEPGWVSLKIDEKFYHEECYAMERQRPAPPPPLGY